APVGEDGSAEGETEVDYNVVTPGFFKAVGLPVLRGRALEEGDEARDAALVDESFARRFFGGADAVGKHFRAGSTVFEIVGVTRGNDFVGEEGAARATVYVPFGRAGEDPYAPSRMVLHARGAAGVQAAAIYEAVRVAAAAADPNVAPEFMMSLAEQQGVALLPQRIFSAVAGAFGALGLVLAAVGVFGMVSYTVAQRTHEIGVRMALGARGRDVLRMVLWQGMRVTLAGVAAGLVGALALTRLLAGLLYGVSPTDPLTFAAITLLITLVALLACLWPARRATRVDPMVALRYE
ncbi:MAG TPA: FtsX-like permease family protein, partial [Pyrinomonadaceae bacterium]